MAYQAGEKELITFVFHKGLRVHNSYLKLSAGIKEDASLKLLTSGRDNLIAREWLHLAGRLRPN